MRIIKNNKSVTENKKQLGQLIDLHLEPLLANKKKFQQKILETCHAGKFLMFLENNFEIQNLSEKPEFIISNGSELIGREHQIIVDKKAREREGFSKNLFDLAELELQKDNSLPHFLANCDIMPYANFKLNEKAEVVSTIVRVVKKYILTDTFEEIRLLREFGKCLIQALISRVI